MHLLSQESTITSRSHNLTLKVPFAKTNTYSFFCDTNRHWNALPPYIIDSIDVEHFKINYMFTSDTCTNLITHLVSYVAFITLLS